MLVFRGDTLKQLYAHAELEYPKECCGIVLGKRLGEQRIALRIIPTPNMVNEDENATHFMINPLDVAAAEKLAEANGLGIIGFYHSHPNYEAEASNADILHMIEGYSYPIVSVKKGKCVEMNSFEKIMQTDTNAKKEEIFIKEKNYADFDIHISDTEELFQSKIKD